MVYVTNAVKHFKFVRKELTRRRRHKKPTAAEVPPAGSGRSGFKVTERRGEPIDSEWAEAVIATVHLSAVLRAPSDVRALARRKFFDDLKRTAEYLESLAAGNRNTRLRREKPRPTVAAGRRGVSVVGADRSG